MPEMNDSAPTLSVVIAQLRRELSAAIKAGAGEDLRFRLKPVEVELKVAITQEIAGEAGVKFWVVNAGGSASRTHEITHTVKLTLDPIGKDGAEVNVNQTTATGN